MPQAARGRPRQSRQMKTPNVDDAQMGLRCGQAKVVRLSALASSFRKTRSRSSARRASAMPAVVLRERTAPAEPRAEVWLLCFFAGVARPAKRYCVLYLCRM